MPVKSAKKCAGNEKEAKAWSTGLDASWGAEAGAETSTLLHLPSTDANRRLNAPAARDTCDHIMSHSCGKNECRLVFWVIASPSVESPNYTTFILNWPLLSPRFPAGLVFQ